MAMNPRLLRPLATSRFAALRVGLVAYWPMNETATSGDVTAEDWTRRGNDLTSNNSVLSAAGRINNGRQFVRANSEWLSVTSADLAFGEPAWTLAFWFFIPTAASNSHLILCAKDESGARQMAVNYNLTAAAVNTANALTWTYYTTGGSGINAGITGVSRNAWHLVTMTHAANSSVINCAMDVTNTATLTRTAGFWSTFSSGFSIGRRNFSGFETYSDAIQDEYAVWNRVLTSSEIDTLYANGSGIDLRR
jgi:hypothetical protein